MIEIRRTEAFDKWLRGLSDTSGRVIRKLDIVVLLLCGGDKASQDRDIRRAKAMAAELKE